MPLLDALLTDPELPHWQRVRLLAYALRTVASAAAIEQALDEAHAFYFRLSAGNDECAQLVEAIDRARAAARSQAADAAH